MQKTKHNSMIISRKGIIFKDSDLDIVPMVCRNDGREYKVIVSDKEAEKGLVLPDNCLYFDPKEYGNVLKMPAHRKLFERRSDLLQKLAPFAIVAGMAVVAFLYVITAG